MNNRKIIFIMVFLLSCGWLLRAQEFSSGKTISFGFRAGGVFSGFTNHQEIFTGTRSGIFSGLSVEFKIAPFLGFSVEGDYSQEGAFHANPFLIYTASSVNYTSDIYKTSSDIRLHMIHVPVFLNIRPQLSGAVKPKIMLGYFYDYLLHATSNDMYMISSSTNIPVNNRSSENITKSFKSWNMGPVAGLGVDFAGGKVTYMLEARYKVGIRNINNPELSTLNSQYSFSVNTFSILFGIGF